MLDEVPEFINPTMSANNRRVFNYFDRLFELHDQLTPAQLQDFESWCDEHCDGHSVSTLDWPGWRTLGLPHIKDYHPEIKRKRRVYKQKPKTIIPEDIRWQVWERDNFTCVYCGRRRYLRIDHIIPESKGGDLTVGNLQTVCRTCNSIKGTKIGPFQRRLR